VSFVLPPTHLSPLTLVDRKTVHDGWLTVEVAIFTADVHGQPATLRREVHDHGHGAAVLAYDAVDRSAVLVRQFRAAARLDDGFGLTIEAIAGLCDTDEDPAETARREAYEEAGVSLKSLDFVGAPYSSPGSVTERVWLYLGEIDHGVPRGPGGGIADEHEAIEVLDLPLAWLAGEADAGRLTDMKTLLLVETLRRRRPDLFG